MLRFKSAFAVPSGFAVATRATAAAAAKAGAGQDNLATGGKATGASKRGRQRPATASDRAA